MIHHIVDSFCYIIEILYDLIMLSSIAGVHIKEMRHPVISAILYFCLGTFFSSLFPGALGWFLQVRDRFGFFGNRAEPPYGE